MWERGIEGRVRFWQPEALWGCFPKSFSLFWTWGQSYGQWQSPESKNTESESLLDSFIQGHMATPKSASCACVCVHVCPCVWGLRSEVNIRHWSSTFRFVWDRLLVAACPRLAGLRASRNVPVSTSHVTMGTLDYRHALSSPKETKFTEK